MATRRFVRSMSGTAAWMAVIVFGLGIAQGVFAQATAAPNERIVITPEVAFAWPILVFIVAASAVWAKMNASINEHHNRKDIHLTREAIASEFPRRSECLLKHDANGKALERIEADVKTLTAALIKGRE